jgi:hypothetical protein
VESAPRRTCPFRSDRDYTWTVLRARRVGIPSA